jgi:hypothetical protein
LPSALRRQQQRPVCNQPSIEGNHEMDAVAFIMHLKEAAPASADLERCGLTGDQAAGFIKSFHCVKRDRPLSEPSGADMALELLRRWDLNQVEIGMVRFPDPPDLRHGGIRIGCVEADPLVLLTNGDGILVYELNTKERLLWHVARDGSALLEALVIAARFLSKRAVGRIDSNDYEAARLTALHCASAAGGDAFTGFYTMLLGAEE